MQPLAKMDPTKKASGWNIPWHDSPLASKWPFCTYVVQEVSQLPEMRTMWSVQGPASSLNCHSYSYLRILVNRKWISNLLYPGGRGGPSASCLNITCFSPNSSFTYSAHNIIKNYRVGTHKSKSTKLKNRWSRCCNFQVMTHKYVSWFSEKV